MKQKLIVDIIAILFAVLFLYTGISKLMDYNVFKEQIATSPLLASVAPIIAWSLPPLEIAVAVLLFLPRQRAKGLIASLALMLAFTLYIGLMLAFNKNIPCSCGGVIELLSWRDHLLFNLVFILLGLLGIVLEKRGRKGHRADSTSFIPQ